VFTDKTGTGQTSQESNRQTIETVRAGLSYKFTP
jgi:hypothetical protein